MNSNKPDKNDFDEWTEHPVTKWVFSEVQRAIDETAQGMGHGNTLASDSIEKTALHTAGRVGFIDGLRELYNIKVVEDKEET